MADRLWRLRPDEFKTLVRAAEVLDKQKRRHSGAKRSLKFINELIAAQAHVDVCPPK